jgi:hypothetical protein
MKTDLISNLLAFLREERIKMELRKTSNSDFWLESPDGFMTVKFVMDEDKHEILYDVFSPKYDVHLREETLRDAERLDFIAEEDGRWEYEKSIEDFLLILDCANLWAHKNGFRVKETNLI